MPLREMTRFDLQAHLNGLAKTHSRSIVQKARTWVKAALDEALEQDFLQKNPARKLEMPKTSDTCKRFLAEDEFHRLFAVLDGRDRLIVHLFLLGALRPGELFALRWRCIQAGSLRIDQGVYRGKIGDTKTRGSRASIALPKSLDTELSSWRAQSGNPCGDDFVFPSRKGSPLDTHNYLQRVLKPAAEKIGIPDLTFQSLRRSFATHVHSVGTVKDAQTQLRHASASTTMDVYTQAIPSSVRAAVEALDAKLCGVLNTTEHKYEM
jgi:integrase